VCGSIFTSCFVLFLTVKMPTNLIEVMENKYKTYQIALFVLVAFAGGVAHAQSAVADVPVKLSVKEQADAVEALSQALASATTDEGVEAAIVQALLAGLPIDIAVAVVQAASANNPFLAYLANVSAADVIAIAQAASGSAGEGAAQTVVEVETGGKTAGGETGGIGLIGGSSISDGDGGVPAGNTNAGDTGSTYN
jgi:hypothetical protein